jgi:transglycosylase-like protein
MARRLRLGCFTVVIVVCAISLSANLYVRPDLDRFKHLLENQSGQTYPPKVVQAVLAVEDPVFFRRSRFYIIRTYTLVLSASAKGKLGGPEIIVDRFPSLAEQMIRSQLEGRSISRSFKAILLCVFVDATVPRQKILNAYLNQVYLGRVAKQPIYGINEAARVYFGVPPAQLTGRTNCVTRSHHSTPGNLCATQEIRIGSTQAAPYARGNAAARHHQRE